VSQAFLPVIPTIGGIFGNGKQSRLLQKIPPIVGMTENKKVKSNPNH
jgi:hypothetical protein